MRDAFLANLKGEMLRYSEQRLLEDYALCAEYTKIAPIFLPNESELEIYRGLKNDGGDYANMLLSLRPGDTFDLQMPSSFSTILTKAQDFAEQNGIILHVDSKDIHDAVSIKGISYYPEENEVLVNDHIYKVLEFEKDKNGYSNLYLKRDVFQTIESSKFLETASTPSPEIEAAKKGIVLVSRLAEKLEKQDIDAIVSLFQKVPENIREAWNLYQDKVQVAAKDVDIFASEYRGDNRAIFVNIAADRKGAFSFTRPYAMTIHESAHAIDHAATGYKTAKNANNNELHAVGISSTYNDDVFLKTLRKDEEKYIADWKVRVKENLLEKRWPEKDASEWIKENWLSFLGEKIKREFDLHNVHEFVDIWDGLLGGYLTEKGVIKVNGKPIGHTKEYWGTDESRISSEAFADMLSATVTNPNGVKLIKKFFPSSYAVFEEIIDSLTKPSVFDNNVGSLSAMTTTPSSIAINGDTVRGVLQSEIDKLRGTRGHLDVMKKQWTPQVIQDDYARVGISITDAEAKEIRQTLFDWMSTFNCQDMRGAAFKNMRGEELTSDESKRLTQYQRIMEYAKIAPTFAQKGYIYRGIEKDNSDYAKELLALKPGDKFDLSHLPSSFSSSHKKALEFGDIVLKLPISKLKNSFSTPSIDEKEVIVADYNLKVKKVEDKGNERIITLDRVAEAPASAKKPPQIESSKFLGGLFKKPVNNKSVEAKKPEKPKNILQAKENLKADLTRQWDESYTKALNSGEDVSEVAKKLSESLGTDFFEKDELEKHEKHAYELGKAPLKLNDADKKVIDILSKHDFALIKQHYDKYLQPVVNEIVSKGLGHDELRNVLSNSKYLKEIADTALSRVYSFASLAAMKEFGITDYEIRAKAEELDNPICASMNGKVFSVAETYKSLEKALKIEDPEKFDEFLKSDMRLPPFYPDCHCTIERAETKTERTEIKPVRENTKPQGSGKIRSVPIEYINKARGRLGHQETSQITKETIQRYYEHVGIKISNQEAHRIHKAIYDYTDKEVYRHVRSLLFAQLKGQKLSTEAQFELDKYINPMQEYCNIAPTFAGTKEIYRGLPNSGSDYSKKILSLKVGDPFDLQIMSSFSSLYRVAQGFAEQNGIILHVKTDDLINSTSIRGISRIQGEDEILVNDLSWEVEKIIDERIDYESLLFYHYHMYLKRKQ